MKKLLLHSCCAPCLIYPHRFFQEKGFQVTAYFYNPNIQPYSEYARRLDAFVEYCEKNSIGYEIGEYDMESYIFEVAPSAFAFSKGFDAVELEDYPFGQPALASYSHGFAFESGSSWHSLSRRYYSMRRMLALFSRWNMEKETVTFAGPKVPADSGGVKHANIRCALCYRIRLDKSASKAKEMEMGLFSTTLLASPYQEQSLIRSAGADSAIAHGVLFIDDDLTGGYRQSVRISRELGIYRQPYCGCVYSEKERYYKHGRF